MFGKFVTHKSSEDYGERVDQRWTLCEAPEEERGERASEGAEEHDPGVRVAVSEVAKDNLTDDSRGVEEREDDRCRERCRELLRERRDVERDGKVGQALYEAGQRLRRSIPCQSHRLKLCCRKERDARSSGTAGS